MIEFTILITLLNRRLYRSLHEKPTGFSLCRGADLSIVIIVEVLAEDRLHAIIEHQTVIHVLLGCFSPDVFLAVAQEDMPMEQPVGHVLRLAGYEWHVRHVLGQGSGALHVGCVEEVAELENWSISLLYNFFFNKWIINVWNEI